MEIYKKMYAILCGAASDALDCLPETAETAEACALLRKALLEAEECYISVVDEKGFPGDAP